MITKLSKYGPHALPCEVCGEWRIYDRRPFNFDENGWENNKLQLLPCTHCYIEKNKSKLTRKEWKRLQFIIANNLYISIELIEGRLKDTSFLRHVKSYINGTKLQKDAHQLFDKLGMDEPTRRGYWILKHAERKSLKEEYKKKPPRIRKDNKDTINYGSGGAQASIRYPKKKRKTAWKRFYKLFPNLDPNKIK